MAQKILIMGESGTGKSTSMRNCSPELTAVVNPVGKPLPFKGSGRFEMLNNVTDAGKISKYIKAQVAEGKKLIVVDDFQYILAVPYMNRIKETGWDKYNDFGANYFEIIDVCRELPDDVVVVYLTHLETLESGLTTVKLIGKLLREKITIEGLFTVVLRTGCSEGKYYFYTQNSGKDTVKSPIGMFPAYAIDNDLRYVYEKVKNYYELGDFKTDSEMEREDQTAAAEIEKPSSGRRTRRGTTQEEAPAPAVRRTHDEVVAENEKKVRDYTEAVQEAVQEAAGDKDGISFDEAMKAADSVQKPELETPPRRTRRERVAAQEKAQDAPQPEAETCKDTTYFYISETDNFVVKHEGDRIPAGSKEVTKEEYDAGVARIAKENTEPMNKPEDAEPASGRARRVRRTRS